MVEDWGLPSRKRKTVNPVTNQIVSRVCETPTIRQARQPGPQIDGYAQGARRTTLTALPVRTHGAFMTT